MTRVMPLIQNGLEMLQSIFPLLLMLGVVFFFVVLPQRKKDKEHKAFLRDLQPGSRIMLNCGLEGLVERLDESSGFVHLLIAPNVVVKVEKTAISRAAN